MPGDGGDDGPLKAGQQIQQGALAHVGTAHNGGIHTPAEHCPGPVALDHGVQLGHAAGEGGFQGLLLQGGHVLLGEIHPGGQMPGQGGELVPQPLNPFGQGAFQRRGGHGGALAVRWPR